MFHSTERLANYLIVKGEIRRETFLEIKISIHGRSSPCTCVPSPCGARCAAQSIY